LLHPYTCWKLLKIMLKIMLKIRKTVKTVYMRNVWDPRSTLETNSVSIVVDGLMSHILMYFDLLNTNSNNMLIFTVMKLDSVLGNAIDGKQQYCLLLLLIYFILYEIYWNLFIISQKSCGSGCLKRWQLPRKG